MCHWNVVREHGALAQTALQRRLEHLLVAACHRASVTRSQVLSAQSHHPTGFVARTATVDRHQFENYLLKRVNSARVCA
jgi:hypothetical protein